ncbi:MAG: sigma-70 family RNA polymerase sigma factor [Limisphaerales bacterium]
MGTEIDQTVDAQLMQRIAQGDREAFATLYDHFAKPLFSLTVLILHDPKEAEDALQEVFLQIWERAAQFDGRVGKPFSWCVTLTRNKAIDRLRSRQRRHRLFEEAIESADVAAESASATTNAGEFGRDEVERIRTAVKILPADQRKAIELAFFDGMTQYEIAEALHEPLGTVKARIRRGMLKLRDCLEAQV